MKRALLYAAAMLCLMAFAFSLAAGAITQQRAADRERAAADRAFRACHGLRVVGTVGDPQARLCIEGR